MKQQETVFVGLSGGVDSAVAAARLKARGFNVVGVFIKVWHPDFMVCNWEQERLDAMRVAAHLEIPFLTCDAETAYKQEVADYFISEYIAGQTPNPDVLCNEKVKFGTFLNFALANGADYIATGHYVQKVGNVDSPELHRGIDTDKDQSYFLWALSNKQLEKALFPIGDTKKSDIRVEAKKLGLPTASKKDSQGICFLGHVDIPEFLSNYTNLEQGFVLDTTGVVIGTHQGALVYTLGQRHGFTLQTNEANREPHYVTAKDLGSNTITVSRTKPTLRESETLQLTNTVLRTSVTVGDLLDVQIRHRQTPFQCIVEMLNEVTMTLRPRAEIEKPAHGQSCVLYRGTHCLGGGIIA